MISNKILKSLLTKKGREKHNKFIIEGPSVVKQCLNFNFPLYTILLDENRLEIYKAIINLAKKQNISVQFVKSNELDKLVDTVENQGVMAIGEIRNNQSKIGKRVVYLNSIQDPGNIGSIIRTAVATSFDTVIFGAGSAELYNPKVIRGSAGAFVNINCITDKESTIIQNLKNEEYKIFVTDCHSGENYKSVEWGDKSVIVLGNEGSGVSSVMTGYADKLITIPINPCIESLNVAVSFGVLAFSHAQKLY